MTNIILFFKIIIFLLMMILIYNVYRAYKTKKIKIVHLIFSIFISFAIFNITLIIPLLTKYYFLSPQKIMLLDNYQEIVHHSIATIPADFIQMFISTACLCLAVGFCFKKLLKNKELGKLIFTTSCFFCFIYFILIWSY